VISLSGRIKYCREKVLQKCYALVRPRCAKRTQSVWINVERIVTLDIDIDKVEGVLPNSELEVLRNSHDHIMPKGSEASRRRALPSRAGPATYIGDSYGDGP
jgi:hypothetical protein